MVAVVAIPSVRPRGFEEVLAEKNIMRTTTRSVKRSVKIAHTPVLTESGGSTCLSKSELLLRGLATPETDIRAHSGRLTSSRPLGAARQPARDRHSPAIRKQLDWVVESADRIFAAAFEIEIAFAEVADRAPHHHPSPQRFAPLFPPLTPAA